jgi:hypothetical protein
MLGSGTSSKETSGIQYVNDKDKEDVAKEDVVEKTTAAAVSVPNTPPDARSGDDAKPDVVTPEPKLWGRGASQEVMDNGSGLGRSRSLSLSMEREEEEHRWRPSICRGGSHRDLRSLSPAARDPSRDALKTREGTTVAPLSQDSTTTGGYRSRTRSRSRSASSASIPRMKGWKRNWRHDNGNGNGGGKKKRRRYRRR